MSEYKIEVTTKTAAPVEPPIETVTLTLDVETARAVRDIFGLVHGGSLAWELYNSLYELNLGEMKNHWLGRETGTGRLGLNKTGKSGKYTYYDVTGVK